MVSDGTPNTWGTNTRGEEVSDLSGSGVIHFARVFHPVQGPILASTERNRSMSPAPKRAISVPGTEGLESKDRQVLPFPGSLLSRWDARHGGGRFTQPGSRVSDTLTARERDVLAMISQGFSNKRIARTLAISPETVKTHVKRIFLKLAVHTRTAAVVRAGSLGLLGLDAVDRHGGSSLHRNAPAT